MTDLVVVDAELVEDDDVTQQWADTISAEWRKTVEGIVGTGTLLIQAKGEIGHGEFGRIFCSRECHVKDHLGANHVECPVPFSDRTGQRLMAVALHKALTNPTYRSHLPPSWRTLSHLAKIPEPILVAHIVRGDVHPELKQGDAFKLWREHREEEVKNQEQESAVTDSVESVESPTIKLYHGDFQEELDEVADESVDLIFTDPPYPKENLPLYRDLSLLARRVLKPKGLLLTYAGNIYIPEVIEHLASHLTYGWTFCLLMDTGTQSRIRSRHVIQAWKPIFAFSVASFPAREWTKDVVVNPDREKSLYEWQQGIAPARELISAFTSSGQTVLDPFMGTGTTGVATLELKRRFVGCEKDKKRYQLAKDRINE